MAINGLQAANDISSVKVYHAGTKLDTEGVSRCSGGRVLAVTGVGPSLKEALGAAYEGVRKISFTGNDDELLMHHRKDSAKGAIGKKLRIGVLGSTRGTALIPVIEACKSGALHAEIVAVVSNKSDAPILDKGNALGPTVTVKALSSKGLSRQQFDAECTSVLLGAGVDYVLLVGYMRILSTPFTDFWSGRCVNVHPSLLPKHAGGMDLAVSTCVLSSVQGSSLHANSNISDILNAFL
jgi:folate-dependent phosphoribosylglycinamide formyltransferase PurN